MKTTHFYLLLLGVVGACSGCPPHPVPTVIDIAAPTMLDAASPPGDMTQQNEYGLPVCPATDVQLTDDCPSMFTRKGLHCYHCPNVSACLDATDVLYCAKGDPGCNDDPLCFSVQDGSLSSGKAKAFRRIPTKLKPKKAKPS